jgi:hypothetical protein
VIAQEKLEGYALNAAHPEGKNKARVFKRVLGFDQKSWALLRDAILDELPYQEAVVGMNDTFGQRYNVTMRLAGPNGNVAEVLTAWIIEHGRNYPSFVTAFVKQGEAGR